MKCGARVALGVAGGYFLGRTKKMKLALMLGTVAAGQRVGGPGELLGQATKLLSASPELTRLTDEVKGRLFDAGKGAALAVAARQVEALTDRVGKRVESIGDTSKGMSKRSKKAQSERESDSEEYDGDQYDDEYEDTASDTDAEDTASDTDAEDTAEPDASEVDVADDEADRPSPRRATGQGRASAGSRAAKGASDGARRTSKATAGARSGRPTRSRRSNDA